MYLLLTLVIIVLLIISFLWALYSLKSELRKIKESGSSNKRNIGLGKGEEIILFDRTKQD